MDNYTFRPMTRADFPMFKDWLDHPHLGGWWGDGGTELRLIEQDMAKADTDPAFVDMRIAEYHDTPFAYIQDYNAHAFGAPHYKGYDKDARAIDTFLGDPSFLGQGHGAGFIGARIRELRQTYPMVLADPHTKNTRAIAAYTRAGFVKDKSALNEDDTPVQIMTYS